MTLVELFEKNPCENVYSCLALSPERVIFVGSDSGIIKKHISIYSQLFSEQGKQCEILYKTVQKNDKTAVTSLFSQLANDYDNLAFDITGGDENLIFLLGSFVSANPDKKIEIHSFNVTTEKIRDVDGNGSTVFFEPPALSVRENILLHGGTCDWDSRRDGKLSEDFEKDLDSLFSVCRENPRGWNSQMGILASLEESGEKDGLETRLDSGKLKSFLARRRSKIIFNQPIMKKLFELKLVTDYRHDGNGVFIKYKNAQVKNCLTKAGLVLELATYITAKRCKASDGKEIYNDAATGVVIDWDGKRLQYDTQNEIDVMLMHGITSVFISCKNGYVSVDELYKLSTVAQRFGGFCARKALVASDLDIDSENGKHLVARAREMGIEMITAKDFGQKRFERKLSNLWR